MQQRKFHLHRNGTSLDGKSLFPHSRNRKVASENEGIHLPHIWLYCLLSPFLKITLDAKITKISIPSDNNPDYLWYFSRFPALPDQRPWTYNFKKKNIILHLFLRNLEIFITFAGNVQYNALLNRIWLNKNNIKCWFSNKKIKKKKNKRNEHQVNRQ